MLSKNTTSIGMLIGLWLVPALAGAAEALPGQPPAGTPAALPSGPVPAPEPAPTEPPTDRGYREDRRDWDGDRDDLLTIEVEGASAYVWRGINKFGANQNDQAFSLFPSVAATFGHVTLGYFGAFQLSGDNKSANVDAGVGGENDFILKFGGELDNGLAYSASLTYWLYPFADPDVAGTDTPMYLEPGVGISYLAGADLGFYLGYYRGLQAATEGASFVYLNPSIGKTIPLDDNLGLAVGISGGYKVFTEDPPVEDRALDLALNLSIAIPFDDMYITPQIHAAYVTRDEDVIPDPEFGDSFVAWVGVHVGYNVGL